VHMSATMGGPIHECDYCREQFHGVCVNVSATNALEIDKYRCSVCIGD